MKYLIIYKHVRSTRAGTHMFNKTLIFLSIFLSERRLPCFQCSMLRLPITQVHIQLSLLKSPLVHCSQNRTPVFELMIISNLVLKDQMHSFEMIFKSEPYWSTSPEDDWVEINYSHKMKAIKVGHFFNDRLRDTLGIWLFLERKKKRQKNEKRGLMKKHGKRRCKGTRGE